MKKYCFMFLACFLSITARAESCADDKGWLVQGRDQKTYYCTSNISMNWWSAFAWCDSIGGELFDVNKECKKKSGTDACPNIRALGMNSWTVNTIDDDTAVIVAGWSGIGTSTIGSLKKTNNYPATCVISIK